MMEENRIFELSGYEVVDISIKQSGGNKKMVFTVEPSIVPEKDLVCPHCSGQMKIHSFTTRRFTDIPVSKVAVEIRASIPDGKCVECGKKTRIMPSSTPKGKRFTERALKFITSPLTKLKSNSELARYMGVSESSIRRIRKEHDDMARAQYAAFEEFGTTA